MAQSFQHVTSTNLLQTLLKDIMIPLAGFRDTSNNLSSLEDRMTRIQQNLSILNEPSTTKSNRAEGSNMFYIEIPPHAYHEVTSFREPVHVELDLNASNENYSIKIQIPAYYSQQTVNPQMLPWCVSCNVHAYRRFNSVVVETIEKQNRMAYRISIPNFDISDITNMNYITTYSENRDVRHSQDGFWSSILPTDSDVTIKNSAIVPLGATSSIREVPNIDQLVYSNSVRRIENVTHEEMNIRLSTMPHDTKPDEVYFLPEKVEVTPTVMLTFDSKEAFLRRIPDLIRDYHDDWSRLQIHFGPAVTEIDSLFKTVPNLEKTPLTIAGVNIRSAKETFANLKHLAAIADQSVLLLGCPNLESVESMFAGCDVFVSGPEQILFASNKRIYNMKKAFQGTAITSTYPFWSSYQKIINAFGREEEVYVDGRGCFDGCPPLVADASIPNTWKTVSNSFYFTKRVHFDQMLPRLLEEYTNDLSDVTFLFGEDVEISGLFRYTKIKKAPKEIEHEGSPANISRVFEASSIEEVYSTTFAKLTTMVSATATFKDCLQLRNVPTTVFARNKSIVDYQYAFQNCISVSGPTPKAADGRSLWNVQGTAGYPNTIYASGCFRGSSFEDSVNVPDSWK